MTSHLLNHLIVLQGTQIWFAPDIPKLAALKRTDASSTDEGLVRSARDPANDNLDSIEQHPTQRTWLYHFGVMLMDRP